VIFELGTSLSQLNEFIDVFGQRFTGLVDPGGSVYQTYRVPNPQAPYPQDYIIDQDGYVRYWSDEYDPHQIIEIIDNLIAPQGIEDDVIGTSADGLGVSIVPNPAQGTVVINTSGFTGNACVRIYSLTGRLLREFQFDQPSALSLDTDLPSGIYLVSLEVPGNSVAVSMILLR
jgi:hypothetical protein